jgi:hypothetical protein
LVAEKKSGKDRDCGIPSFRFFVVCRKRRFVGSDLASANERTSGGGRSEPGTGEENSREDEAEGSLESGEGEGEVGLDDAGFDDLGREGEQPAEGGRPTTEAGDNERKVDVEATERDRLREREKILIKKCRQMNNE